MQPSHRRELFLMISLALVFAIIFAIAVINLNRHQSVFGLGISYVLEDYIIIILSVLSLLRILWSVVKH